MLFILITNFEADIDSEMYGRYMYGVAGFIYQCSFFFDDRGKCFLGIGWNITFFSIIFQSCLPVYQ